MEKHTISSKKIFSTSKYISFIVQFVCCFLLILFSNMAFWSAPFDPHLASLASFFVVWCIENSMVSAVTVDIKK